MKVVILAGGLGTRISEESNTKPKPMIEIGGIPILVHIMNVYSKHGFNEFVICAGYKQNVIKDFFANFYLYSNDIEFDLKTGNFKPLANHSVDWKVSVVDTGLYTQTGGRIKRIKKIIGNEPFMLTYGDAVGDINLKELLKRHKESGNIGTMSVYNFGQTKGVVELDSNKNIRSFREKSDYDGNLINIGFMVFEPEVFNYIQGDDTVFEREPLRKLAEEGRLGSYIHKGFWQCMDTLNEKNKLEKMWNDGNAPWK